MKVNNEQAPLWKAIVECDNKATAYVASKDNHTFSCILYDNRPLAVRQLQPVLVEFFLDGHAVCDVVFRSQFANFCEFDGIADSPKTMRPFVFGQVSLTDQDAQACRDSSFLNHVGSIRGQIHRARITGTCPAVPFYDVGLPQRQIYEVDAKATLSHQVRTGEYPRDRPKETSTFVGAAYIDSPTEPRATFEIKYRSRELLEAQGIMPIQRYHEDNHDWQNIIKHEEY